MGGGWSIYFEKLIVFLELDFQLLVCDRGFDLCVLDFWDYVNVNKKIVCVWVLYLDFWFYCYLFFLFFSDCYLFMYVYYVFVFFFCW